MWFQVFLDSYKKVSLGNLVASRTDLSLLRTELWRLIFPRELMGKVITTKQAIRNTWKFKEL